MKNRIMAFAALAAFAAAPVWAAELRPDQQEAVELMLAQMDPSMREPFRAQVEESVAMLTKEQVAALVASMKEGADEEDYAPADDAEDEEAPTLSPEDYAYNKAQYEPAIRKSWKAQKEFDDYVDAKLAGACPSRDDQYALFGSAVRYELPQLAPFWPRASDDVDGEIAVLGSSFAPQDGRYDFDFSAVRTSFNKPAVDAAIVSACSEWKAQATAFRQKASALFKAENYAAVEKIQREYEPKIASLAESLGAAINRESPAGNNAVINALMNGKRVK